MLHPSKPSKFHALALRPWVRRVPCDTNTADDLFRPKASISSTCRARIDTCLTGVDTFRIEVALVDTQANNGEQDAEAGLVCTERTIDPTGVTSCAVSSEADE